MGQIITGIPLGHKVGSLVLADSVMHMPNAQVIDSIGLKLRDLNNRVFTGYILSNMDYVKILEIFDDKLLVLVGSDLDDDYWRIGYFNFSDLITHVMIRRNTVAWKNSLDKKVYDMNKNIIYTLPATQVVQFLYETVDNNYACILFNDGNGNLQTGYVSMNDGIFYRYPELPINKYPRKPNILNISQQDKFTEIIKSKGILKVGDLTLSTDYINILNLNNEIVYESGYTNNLVKFIKIKEGFSEKAYLDSTSHLTIGYGHLIVDGDGFNSDSVITLQQAESLLLNDLDHLTSLLKISIKRNFPSFKFNNTYEFDAVLDLAYNNGLIIANNTLEHSIFKDYMNNQISHLQYDFCEWCHGNINGKELVIFGLYKRKLEDFIMFSTGLYVTLNAQSMTVLERELNFISNFNKSIWY